MKPAKKGAVALAFLLAASPFLARAQTAGKFLVRPFAEAYFPLNTYTNEVTGESGKLYSAMGFVGGAALDYTLKSWLYPFVRFDYLNMPFSGGASLSGGEADLGLGLVYRPFDRLALRLDAMGGLASISTEDQSGTALSAGARLGLAFRLNPALTLSASGGYSALRGTEASILSALGAGLSVSYDLSTLAGVKPKVAVEDPKLEAVFPSLYAYYDENAFGTVVVTNREDAKVSDVKVSFFSSRYMDQPKPCAEYESLGKGESVRVPLKALFSDSVLQVTQGIDAKGEIVVTYSYLGADRETRVPLDYRLHHRNAITWSDDRRAAAFVSPTNPAAMWFAKFGAGVVRDRMRGEINKPLQYAIGMFEAERLYGLNYVVVPANDYSVKHGLKDYVDSVQFPHQTLQNRGGDCSDLAILFSSLMQSVGVNTAFITIPGHIFSAFDTGLSEEEARAEFYDPGLLIFKDGKAWIPLEITMVKDGFNKAWSIGAKEWHDSSRRNEAAFYRVPDCWKVYPPAAFPGVNPRFVLPAEVDEAMAFDLALDRYVARETRPRIEALGARLAGEPPATRSNELGILYAHFGLYKDSWKELSGSAKDGCPEAWTNLGNVAYIRRDYKLALSYYEWAYKKDQADDNALLGIARCQYELENFNSSDEAYASLKERNPELAGKFGYLGSVFGGEGRAWSLSERAASTRWASALKPAQAAALAAPIAAPPAEQPAVVPASAEAPVVASAAESREPPKVISELPQDVEIAAAAAAAEARKQAAQAEAAEKARALAVLTEAADAEARKKAEAEERKRAAEVAAIEAEAKRQAEREEARRKAEEAAAEAPAVAVLPAEPEPAPQEAPAEVAQEPAAAPAPVAAPVEPAPVAAAEPEPEVAPEPPAVAVLQSAPEAAARQRLLVSGFEGARSIFGTWIVSPDKATQTDRDCYFAKLGLPLDQKADGSYEYSFVAKSTARGRGWVGVGAHLFAPEARLAASYGWKDSIVVWLTRDPVHYQKDVTRIQVYRSIDDYLMKLVAEAPVSESIYSDNRFDVRVDPAAGSVTVSLNGTERLRVDNVRKLRGGGYVVLRALDTAEFSAYGAGEAQ